MNRRSIILSRSPVSGFMASSVGRVSVARCGVWDGRLGLGCGLDSSCEQGAGQGHTDKDNREIRVKGMRYSARLKPLVHHGVAPVT